MAWMSFVHCNKYVYSIEYLWRIQEQAIGYQHMGETGLGDKRTTARAMFWHGCEPATRTPPSSLELAFSL